MIRDPDTSNMTSPVRCAHCYRIYDLGTVTVTARYVDCSVWDAPCCGRTVDDRGETGWKSQQDYTRLDRAALQGAGRRWDEYGMNHWEHW